MDPEALWILWYGYFRYIKLCVSVYVYVLFVGVSQFFLGRKENPKGGEAPWQHIEGVFIADEKRGGVKKVQLVCYCHHVSLFNQEVSRILDIFLWKTVIFFLKLLFLLLI